MLMMRCCSPTRTVTSPRGVRRGPAACATTNQEAPAAREPGPCRAELLAAVHCASRLGPRTHRPSAQLHFFLALVACGPWPDRRIGKRRNLANVAARQG